MSHYDKCLSGPTELCGEESRAEPAPADEGEWKPSWIGPVEDEAAAIARDSMERPLSQEEILGRIAAGMGVAVRGSAQMDNRLGATAWLLEDQPEEEAQKIRMDMVRLWDSRRIR